MGKLLSYMGMFVGSWAGWAIGAQISLFTAFMVSMVGTGIGLYAARRVGAMLP